MLLPAGVRNRARYTYDLILPCTTEIVPATNGQAPTPCKEPWLLTNGSMVYSGYGSYNSSSYLDDLTWAAAWLYRATGDTAYSDDAYT